MRTSTTKSVETSRSRALTGSQGGWIDGVVTALRNGACKLNGTKTRMAFPVRHGSINAENDSGPRATVVKLWRKQDF
ncbi:hypothetical protein HBH64_190340 [Parastagonospora nodorum]|nr:hypothetical protein HBI05_133670 [Parastagonospora nodorum]KAH4242035.1 hypothetical protein HBI06_013590 [Parastagonospora nodorum]KAH4291569.1 hypothetical protein HBI01_191810 [Parastagonospora nodorum]KAH4291969.1 hypothetical protein HBI02_194330 [Parastagonospora nodorum]KAH4323051.1 hypothetical protein HBI00_186640 [Parastagonospora nodorum]